VSPDFKYVVASNYDTLYSSAFLDLTAEPVVVTVPAAQVGYSILVLDYYGNQIPAAISVANAGRLCFHGPGFSGTLPSGVTQIPMPINFPLLNFQGGQVLHQRRGPEHRSRGVHCCAQDAAAQRVYKQPSHGPTIIAPESYFTKSFKTTADNLIASKPLTFSSSCRPRSSRPRRRPYRLRTRSYRTTSTRYLANGTHCSSGLTAGTQKAFEWIINNYLTNTGQTHGSTSPISPTAGSNFLDPRVDLVNTFSNPTESARQRTIQTFSSGDGSPLNGSDREGYVLTFPADRFRMRSSSGL